MKLGILSDTHDQLKQLKKALEFFQKNDVKKILFAGDLVSPFVIDSFIKTNIPVIAVFGNNEGEKVFIKEKFKSIGEIYESGISFTIENKTFFMTHYDHIAQELADHTDYDFIIFGHTHHPIIEKHGKTILINPGECCGLLTGESTVAILNTETSQCEIHIIT